MLDLLVRNGLLFDGTGKQCRPANVGIVDGHIAQVGDTSDVEAKQYIEAEGMAVAPGFIDSHQHGDVTPLVDGRCISSLGQGVTTIVVGNCGHGVAPGVDASFARLTIIGYRDSWNLNLAWATFDEYLTDLSRSRPAINIAALVGHSALRLAVVGQAAREATSREIALMQRVLEDAIAAGAIGLSSGLEYSPGRHANGSELKRLCSVVARHGGVYASHIRNRGDDFGDAVAEALEVAEATGVRLVLSHLAPRPYASVEDRVRVRQMIAHARQSGISVTVDTFPEAWGPATIASLLPPWTIEEEAQRVVERMRQPEVRRKIRESFDRGDNFLVRIDGPDPIRVNSCGSHPEFVGMTLGEIGRSQNKHPAEVVCDLVIDEGQDFYSILVQHRYADESDLDVLYADPFCAFESDGVVASPDGPLSNVSMNRSTYGYTARVLGELVRERHLLSLEEAVRRMSSLPADVHGLANRGRIAVGAAADLVVFDPGSVRDLTTERDFERSPAGINSVVVAGQIAWKEGGPTDVRAGQVLRRGNS